MWYFDEKCGIFLILSMFNGFQMDTLGKARPHVRNRNLNASLGSHTIGDGARKAGGFFPGVETTGQVRDIEEAATPQNAGGD